MKPRRLTNNAEFDKYELQIIKENEYREKNNKVSQI